MPNPTQTAMLPEEETEELNVYFRRGLFDNKQRQLLITPDFIQFENKSGNEPFVTFTKDEVLEYRYGINWIRGYQFTIGREYVIFVRNTFNEVLKINFNSFYGFKKKEHHRLNNQILVALWKFYFGNITGKFINEFNKGNDITIGRATLTQDFIVIDEGGIISHERKMISWECLKTKEYYTYFAICSSKGPSKLNATFSYLKDWNTIVLINVIMRILQNNKTQTSDIYLKG